MLYSEKSMNKAVYASISGDTSFWLRTTRNRNWLLEVAANFSLISYDFDDWSKIGLIGLKFCGHVEFLLLSCSLGLVHEFQRYLRFNELNYQWVYLPFAMRYKHSVFRKRYRYYVNFERQAMRWSAWQNEAFTFSRRVSVDGLFPRRSSKGSSILCRHDEWCDEGDCTVNYMIFLVEIEIIFWAVNG